jgi:two-component system response regulator FixJ
MMHIPVVMLTSHGDETRVVEAIRAGAVDFIVKPSSRATLLEKVAKFAGGRHPVAPLG